MDAGYTPYRKIGENLAFWGVPTGSLPEIRQVAANLVEERFKSPSHRKSFMDPEFREVGTAMVTGPFRYEGTAYNAGLGGQNFGKRDVDPFLTGVGCRTKLTDSPICDVTTAISGERSPRPGAATNRFGPRQLPRPAVMTCSCPMALGTSALSVVVCPNPWN